MSHSHRSAFASSQKPFKGKSKGRSRSRVDGRMGAIHPGRLSFKSESEPENSKSKRLNQQAQIRANKRLAALRRHRRGVLDATPPPRVLGIIGVHAQVDTRAFAEALGTVPGQTRVLHVESGAETLAVLPAGPSIMEVLDVAKVSDVVALVLSAEVVSAGVIDSAGDHLLSLLFAQGMPTVVPVISGLDRLAPALRKKTAKLAHRYVETVLAAVCKKKKVKVWDTSALDTGLFLRHCGQCNLKSLSWREGRVGLLAEHVRVLPGGCVAVSGVVRGDVDLTLNAHQLLHVTGFGDFKVQSVESPDGEVVSSSEGLATDMLQGLNWAKLHERQAEQQEFAIDDDEDMQVEDEEKIQEFSDDDEWMSLKGDEDQHDKEMKCKWTLREREEKEFPDEVDTPTDMFAKDRFAKYRGLDSFGKSDWLVDHLPDAYSLIYRFPQLEAAHAQDREVCSDRQGARAGDRVTVVLSGVSEAMAMDMMSAAVLAAWGLFDHERKVSIVHANMQRGTGQGWVEGPVKSKEAVVMQYGFRRVRALPLYSAEGAGGRAKTSKFLGDQSTVSCFARVVYGNPSVMMFSETGHPIATGKVEHLDPDKLLLKRVVLTGYPFKVNKRKSVIRFMFWSPEDVRWFAPVKLFTKYGLTGRIDEPLGTKGLFKASFDNFIKHHDTVCLHLYKRQFPPFQAELFEGAL